MKSVYNYLNWRLWYFGSDITGIGWKFFKNGHRRAAYYFFVIGREIENFAEDHYIGAAHE